VAGADLARWGLSPDAAVRRLHARAGGRVLAGLPAFRAVWAVLPGWRWLARATGLPGVRPLADALYERAAAPALYALHRRRVARGLCKAPRRT
jgi:predicted DCC family thiol-disulfide oxidoreductase YuxK